MQRWSTIYLALVATTAWGAMPAAEQNALIRQYCAVCHSDRSMNGGLSLERYDAAKRDPGLAAMILSKLNIGAMGAAGNGVPNEATQRAWIESTREQAAGAKSWFVALEGGVVTASIVQEVPPRKPGSADVPLYRVRLACDPATGVGEMQLTWSPEPQTGRSIRVTVDEGAPIEYLVEGREAMGNGAKVQTGRAALLLSGGGGRKIGLPARSLGVRDLFPGESVRFPFADLPGAATADLRKCF